MRAAPVLVAFAVAAVAWAIGGSLSELLFKVAPVSLACLVAVMLHALWDCPLRCPAVLMTLFGLAAAEKGH